MIPGFAEWMRKRGQGLTSFAPQGLPELDYDVETPGGSVEVTRQPLGAVAKSNEATVSGDDNEERTGILGDLSGDISVDEKAALNDPRASASQQAARGNFDRMSNIFLNAGGLAPLTPQKDPYVSERDGMRDWVMKRGGVAQGQQANKLSADRTGAYLAATTAQQARAAQAAELQATKEGRLADAERLKAERLKLEDDRKKFESERDQKNKDRDFDLRAKAEAKKKDKSKAGPKGAPKGFPAGWELEGNTTPTPKQGEEFEGLVFSGEKMKGMASQMKKLLAEAGNSGRVIPGPMKSRLKQLATEIMIEGKNVADLGALSGPDMGLMQAIAADPTAIDSAMKDMPALLDGLGAWADNSVGAKAKSLGARRTQATPAKNDDAKAIAWAKANPDDPRSGAILKKAMGK